MKHTAIYYHFTRVEVQTEALRVTHVSSENQLISQYLNQVSSTNHFELLKTKIEISIRAPSGGGILEELIYYFIIIICFTLFHYNYLLSILVL